MYVKLAPLNVCYFLIFFFNNFKILFMNIDEQASNKKTFIFFLPNFYGNFAIPLWFETLAFQHHVLSCFS